MALDKSGKITAFEAKVTGQSIYKNTVFDGILYKDGVDGAQKEGLATHPYAILNNDMQAYTPDSPIPVLWWRSVGHTQSGPFVECMIDEAAHAAGADPVVYRISMLANNQRYITLLKDVATLAHWDERKKEKNVGYGVAIVGSFQSVCAQIAKVRVNESGNDYKVEKVWCSIDCGFAFSPLNVENQVMGSINYGLAAVKYSEITIKNGAAEQNNFYDYQVTRISDAPEIEVSIINSDNPIGGIGEPGTPPIFGAVANAIFDATGKRHHSYPIRLS
jgi:isoquinoline 1-oxidoreductase beta subunit